jgi:hypothetical protein
MVPAGRQLIFGGEGMRIATRTSTQAQTRQTRCVMMELFTMLVLAANLIAASAFAKFAPTVAADVAAAHEQFSDANTFEGRVVAKIQARNERSSAVLRDSGESTGAYWGSPLF